MIKSRKKIIALIGPTGSGKTALGIKLAKRFDGEIISADSRQVYRGLDIVSGKEGKATDNLPLAKKKDLQYLKKCRRYINCTPQWLIDICQPEKRFTLFDWLELAEIAIVDIVSRGKLPIIVGGTGLYVSALIEGYQIESVEEVDTNYSRKELEAMDRSKLFEILKSIDPKTAKGIDQDNPYRLLRATEKALSGECGVRREPKYQRLVLALEPERSELYRRIDQRACERFAAGLFGEVAGLLKSGVDNRWLISLGLDCRLVTEYLLNNDFNIECQGEKYKRLLTEFQNAEHHYARRQLTWWRKREREVVFNSREAILLLKKFLGQ